MEGEFFFDPLFEGVAFFEGERVGFSDYGDDVDDVGEFLEDDDVDWFEAVVWLARLGLVVVMLLSRHTRDQMVG